MNTRQTVSVFTENSPGVLHRITVLFTRRKINIESLTVSETERKGISRFTIVVNIDHELMEKIAKQIARIVEVVNVSVNEDNDLIFKEIGFIRVHAEDSARRKEIEEVSSRHGADIAYVDRHSLVIEQTGTEDQINSLFLLLEPYGVEEFIRSGRIAVQKDSKRSCTS